MKVSSSSGRGFNRISNSGALSISSPASTLTMDNNFKTGKAAVVIENIAGCGMFQVTVSILVYFLGNSATAFTMLLMTFGNYNPGWRCNDHINTTLNTRNLSFVGNQHIGHMGDIDDMFVLPQSKSERELGVASQKSSEYIMEGNCPLFESCKHIEFDPTSVTIVSEWGLICDKKWIPSIIIMLQMGGSFLGCFISGYFGDAFGRRPAVYGAILGIALLNFVSVFSVSWEMFAVTRFIIGAMMAIVTNLYYVYTAEFVPEKWRSVLQGVPAWNISTTLFTLTCMGLKNWRHVIIVTSCVGIAGFIPVFWVPESLRWLEAKNKSESFKCAAEKVVRMNGKALPEMEDLQNMAASNNQKSKVHDRTQKYNIYHLFKNGYAKYTILLSFPWLFTTGINYALTFSIKVLHGNFYTNLLISGFFTIPLSVFYIFMPNLMGRKKSGLIFIGMTAMCLFGAAVLEFFVTSESVKSIGVPAFIFTTKGALDGIWCILAILSMELYPTVIRGLGMSWGSTMSRIGGVLSPFLIPNTTGDAAVFYTIMAAISCIGFGVFLFLPETKGMPLQDAYGANNSTDDDDKDGHYEKHYEEQESNIYHQSKINGVC